MAKTYTNLSDATAGSVLTATAYNNHIANTENFLVPATCGAFHNTTQSIANATFTAIGFNSEPTNWDTDTIHSTSSNTSRFTLTTAGLYLFNISVSFAANATGRRLVAVREGGTNFEGIGGIQVSQPQVAQVNASWVVNVISTSTYYEFVAFQDSGGALNLLADDPTVSGTYCRASVTWLNRITLP